MDRSIISDLAHVDHPVAAPLSDATVDRLLRTALAGRGSVLDLGCGDGTWLLRALLVDPTLRAVGVDLSGAGFDRVLDAADQAGVGDRLELHRRDASDWTADEPFDVALCVGAAHAFGGWEATLAGAGRHLAPGGVLLVGDCFWEREPGEPTLQALGADVGDFADLAATVAAAEAAGWRPLQGHVSTLAEWDDYEWSWTGSLTRWAVAHPDHPDAAQVLDVAADHRRAWLDGYRATLGFLTLLLTR